MNFKAMLSTAVFAIAGSAFAQSSPQISPQSIIVNPVQPDLQVNVRVDKAGENPVYAIGERIRISVSVNADAYVYLFSVHSDGEIDLILPNKLSGGNEQLRAGETRTFPPQGGGYTLDVAGPAGQDKVLAVASKRPLNLDEIASFRGNQPFATSNVRGQDNLARALSIVVTPVPASDWVTGIAYFQVGRGTTPPPAPQSGSVQVVTRQGASVFLDGQLVGQAPITINTTPGRHTIKVTAPGFRDEERQINVNAGRSTVLTVNLTPIPQEGTLIVRSNVTNARVFINGQEVGRINNSGTLSIGNLPAGNHEVVVLAPGYRAFVQAFTITPGQVTNVTANLFR